MSERFKDKVVVITGASSGIGLACSKAFAKEGALIVMAARNDDKLQEAAKRVREEGTDVVAIKTDVSNKEDCRNLMEKTVATFHKIDILINNAGISMRAMVRDVDVEVIEKLMNINFLGTMYCTKYALADIEESKGSIIGISSIAGYKGLPARSGYSASKHAMQGFLESLRIETLKKGVHVMIACPGFTASNIRHNWLNAKGESPGQSPMDEGKMMTAEEVAQHILKATLKRKRTLVLTRQGKLTIFLSKYFPKLSDKLVFNHFAKMKDSPLEK